MPLPTARGGFGLRLRRVLWFHIYRGSVYLSCPFGLLLLRLHATPDWKLLHLKRGSYIGRLKPSVTYSLYWPLDHQKRPPTRLAARGEIMYSECDARRDSSFVPTRTSRASDSNRGHSITLGFLTLQLYDPRATSEFLFPTTSNNGG